ncbi:hypothetical protein D3C71_1883770 [compost metagenome]
MPMAVMNVRVMRMLVRQHLMPVGMRVRLRCVPSKGMRVLMVLVMRMPVAVLQRLMAVFVLMPLADMQPDANCHQRGGRPEEWARHVGP